MSMQQCFRGKKVASKMFAAGISGLVVCRDTREDPIAKLTSTTQASCASLPASYPCLASLCQDVNSQERQGL